MSAHFESYQARPENAAVKHTILNQEQGFECVDSTETNHNLAKNKEAVLTLLENGMILNCNQAAANLLGCDSNKLTWQHISRLLPQLTNLTVMLDKKINPYLKFLSAVSHHFDVKAMDGTHFACELFFSEGEDLGRHCLRIVMQPVKKGQPSTLRHLRAY